jgi:hypothetical protein
MSQHQAHPRELWPLPHQHTYSTRNTLMAHVTHILPYLELLSINTDDTPNSRGAVHLHQIEEGKLTCTTPECELPQRHVDVTRRYQESLDQLPRFHTSPSLLPRLEVPRKQAVSILAILPKWAYLHGKI